MTQLASLTGFSVTPAVATPRSMTSKLVSRTMLHGREGVVGLCAGLILHGLNRCTPR
ncbi:hypothetical protein [Nitratireductor pacificus]|uniref:hypothetical protein n=1 Tax=Nitratireductor pacificus TaxID=1231180 RepID=UPI0003187D19|nr:hypothetical protein [Nitratireductor pacificus]